MRKSLRCGENGWGGRREGESADYGGRRDRVAVLDRHLSTEPPPMGVFPFANGRRVPPLALHVHYGMAGVAGVAIPFGIIFVPFLLKKRPGEFGRLVGAL